MNKSIKIFIKWFLGPILAAWLFYSLYVQVKEQPRLNEAIALIRKAPWGEHAWKFWLSMILVFVNWGIEARKWQLLVRAVHPIHFFNAFKSVLCGVTFSLNMPNRMGEYAGRVLFIKEGHRLEAISLSIAGSMAQLIITMLMGCLGLAWLMLTQSVFTAGMGLSPFWLQVFFYGSVLGTLVFGLVFFRLRWMVDLLIRLPYGDKLAKYATVPGQFDVKILLRLLCIALVRYIVFVLQCVLFLQLMEVEQRYWTAFWLVSVMYWVMAIIPSIAIAELGIRGTIAKTLFAYSLNTIGILAATFGIWFANLFIPALAGSLLILSIKIKKEK